MDPNYLSTLKNLSTSNPKKIKVENKEIVLMENEENLADKTYKEFLTEIFIQSGEIEAMPKGKERDMQIIRLSIIAEMDASNLYEKLALLASDKRLVKILKDISREEKVHVGEFETALEEIDPEYETAEEEGEDEVEKML
jgi:hypothetical protein